MAADTENNFAALARSDARAAGAELVNLYGASCYRLAFRLLQNREDALDCVQEAFVRVFRNIKDWRGTGSPRAWVMRIISNEAFRYRRSRARAASNLPEQRNPMPGPSDEAARRENTRFVRTALAGLPPAQRETLTLRHFAGLSLAEIAAERGCALGTVKATLFQAYKAMRGALPDEARPEV